MTLSTLSFTRRQVVQHVKWLGVPVSGPVEHRRVLSSLPVQYHASEVPRADRILYSDALPNAVFHLFDAQALGLALGSNHMVAGRFSDSRGTVKPTAFPLCRTLCRIEGEKVVSAAGGTR